MSTSVVPRFRVAVCGAGPAGLTIASTIVKFSDPASPIAVDVYESRQVVDTVGAGIVVWERTHALAEDLGLMDTLKTELGPTESPDGPKYSITYRKSDDNEGYDFFRFVPLRAPMALHRRALIDSLISTLPPESSCNIHTSSHLTSFSYADPATHSGPITLRFKDGSTRTADIVIGTDGVRSAVRNSMFSGGIYDNTTSSSAVQPVWTGKIVYRALALPEKLLATPNVVPQALTKAFVYCGQDRHVVAYPIANGKFINIVAFVDVPGGYRTTYKGSEGGKWVHDVSTAEVVASYPNWEPEVLALLQSPDKYSAWAMHAIEDAPHAVIGKAAIVGDALHAMETHFAAGVGQAMEDAYVLGRLLSHSTTTLSTLPSALAAYEDTRLAFGVDLVHRSRAAGQLYEFRTGVVPDGRVPMRETTDGIHLLQKGEDWATRWAEQMMELWNWQWEELPEDIWQRALKNFQERTQQLK